MSNITNHPSKLTSGDIEDIVNQYRTNPLVTSVSLSEKYGCSAVIIAKYLRRGIDADEYAELKLLRNPTYPGKESVIKNRKMLAERAYNFRHRVNHKAFDPPMTPEKAYWIGFLLADGCVYDNRIVLGLNARDESHVKLFQKFVQGEYYSICRTASNNASTFKFVSKHMSGRLVKYGIVPCKSLTECFGAGIAELLMSHYVRGVFDGDGSVHMDSRPRIIVQITAGEFFCSKMIDELNKHNIHSIGPYASKSRAFSVQVQNSNAKQFLNWIYAGSTEDTRLSRKFKKYRDIID